MLKKLKLLFAVFFLSMSAAIAQTGTGTIRGSVTDAETGEPLPFVNVIISQEGQRKGAGKTDFDGRFTLSSLTPGEYDVEVRFVNYQTQRNEGIVVNSDRLTIVDFALGSSSELLDIVEVIHYEVLLLYLKMLLERCL